MAQPSRHLLYGEPEDSTDEDEVELWLRIYSELHDTVQRLVHRVRPAPPELVEHLRFLEERRGDWANRRGGATGRASEIRWNRR